MKIILVFIIIFSSDYLNYLPDNHKYRNIIDKHHESNEIKYLFVNNPDIFDTIFTLELNNIY
jgi:hypothetical protein